MKFGRRYSKTTVFMAMLQGVLIGVAAVALIAVIIIGTDGKRNTDQASPSEKNSEVENPEAKGEELPVSSSVKPVELFARQHGVFTSKESAQAFITENPMLVSAVVTEVAGQYFIWTAVGLAEIELFDSESKDTFRKRLVADTSACNEIGAENLRQILLATDSSKIKISEVEQMDEKVAKFEKNIAAITAFTNDIRVIRLHLLSHYASENGCVKITF